MTETDLRAAIEYPARLASLVVEPGLVDLLVNDVADQAGALPLMSHALAETWQRREGRTLTVAGYNASGGIRGAVAQSAEEIYERIPAGQRTVLRDLMLRLVTPGPEGEPVRSRLPRRLVVAGPENDAMIDLLVGSRLVTSDAGVVELAHESLARAWPRLRGWLDDDLEGQQILHHLATLADSWDTLGRPDSELYRGVRLAKALDWQERTTLALTAIEQDFLAESKRLSEAELRAAESQARHQVRVNRRLRAALTTSALLLVGALIAGLVAVRQAERAERVATSELARRVGARAQLTEGISHSLLLAAHGARLDDSPETRANLVAAIDKHPKLVRSFPAPSGYVNGISVSPDGSRIAAGEDRAAFHVYDTDTGRVTDSYSFGSAGIEPAFSTALYSPDGRYLAATTAPSMLRLLDAETLDPLPIAVPPSNFPYLDIAFSADSRYLAASVWADSDPFEGPLLEPVRLLVWDLGSAGRAPREVAVPRGAQGIVLSPDGRTIYSQLPLTAYDVATGKQKWQRPDLRSLPSIDISTRGDLLALQLQNQDGTDATAIGLVDAHTGKTVKVLRGHAGPPRSLAFSRDGTLLGSASLDGEVIVWEVATGTPRDRIKTFESLASMTVAAFTRVGFSPDGQTLYTGGDEGIIRVYDLSGQRQHLRRAQAMPARDYLHVLTSDDGRTTAYLWRDGKDSWVSFADTTTGATTTPARLGIELEERPEIPWTSATWHPNGRHLAIHDIDEITVADSQTGKVRKEHLGLDISAMTYVERGDRIAVGDGLGYLRFFDAETLLPSDTVPLGAILAAASPDGETAVLFNLSPDAANQHWQTIHTATGTVVSEGDLQRLRVNDATYSPDGRLIAVIGHNGEVLTFDAQSKQVRRAPTAGHNDDGLFVRFSPDGSRLVSGAADGTVSLWDTHTLDLLGTVATSTGAEPVAVSPSFADGNDIVTIAAYDGKTYRWDTRLDQAIAYACTMAGRNLTRDEWTQAFGDRPYEKTCP